jgi:hypothetical protein
MIAALIRWSVATAFWCCWPPCSWLAGVWGRAQHADRRAARPVGRAGHHPHQLPRPGAADRREPGHLPAGHHHAVGAGREDGARLLVLRRQFRLRAVRRRHRPVLGALARAGVPEPGAGPPAGHGASPRWGPTPPVWAGSTSTRWWTAPAQRPVAAARAAGLVPEVRAEEPEGCGRGGQRGRHGQAVPGGAGPVQAGRLRHHLRAGARRR